MRAAVLLPLALGCMVGASGCGAGRAEPQVRGVVARFDAALQRHDDAAACAELSQDARSALERTERKSCPTALDGLDLSPAPVERIEVAIQSARVALANGESVFLDRTTSGWRISAAGCTPQGDDEPYDCELEV